MFKTFTLFDTSGSSVSLFNLLEFYVRFYVHINSGVFVNCVSGLRVLPSFDYLVILMSLWQTTTMTSHGLARLLNILQQAWIKRKYVTSLCTHHSFDDFSVFRWRVSILILWKCRKFFFDCVRKKRHSNLQKKLYGDYSK